ncbi:g3452 [Coccomyxa elongata]
MQAKRDAKRAKPSANTALIDLRKSEKKCTHCGKSVHGHPIPFGSKCTAPFAPATDVEVKAMSKGKYASA